MDAGPETVARDLEHNHDAQVSPATISRHLTRLGPVVLAPRKRPKSSYVRFEAAMPNECWQCDFTHYRLTALTTTPAGNLDGAAGTDVEILSWLDDCSRYLLDVSAHRRVAGPIVLTTFREAVALHGIPTSTLADNRPTGEWCLPPACPAAVCTAPAAATASRANQGVSV